MSGEVATADHNAGVGEREDEAGYGSIIVSAD